MKNKKYQFEIISIHALVKRATTRTKIQALPELDFNPRPREEGDC